MKRKQPERRNHKTYITAFSKVDEWHRAGPLGADLSILANLSSLKYECPTQL